MNDTMQDRAVVPAPNQSPVMPADDFLSIAAITERVARIQTILEQVMTGPVMSDDGEKVVKHGVHFDIIPGCQKPSLLQPGAEVLLMAFRLGARHEIQEIKDNGEIRYRVRCIIYDQRSGIELGDEWGECSSTEDKYAWNKASCDSEFEETENTRRRIIWKKGWQGAQDKQVKQVRVNPADVANTILAMACKRAKVRATRAALACSSIFDVNLEDIPEGMREQIAGRVEDQPTPEQRDRAADQSRRRNATNAANRTGATVPGSLTSAQDAAGEVVVTFGTHKGKKLRDIPRNYIEYLHDKAQAEAMRTAAGIFLGKIVPEGSTPTEATPTAPDQQFAGDDPAYPPDGSIGDNPADITDPFADQA
jgi:hypothetical protein